MNEQELMLTELEMIMAAAKLGKDTTYSYLDIASILAYSMNLTLPLEAPQFTRIDVGSVLNGKYELKYYIWYLLEQGFSQYHIIKRMGFSNSQVTRETNGEVNIDFRSKTSNTLAMVEPWKKIRTGFLDLNNITKKDIVNVRRRF